MRSTARRHALPNVLVLTAVATVVAGCGGGSADPSATEQPQAVAASTGQASLPPFNFEIRTLSNRADLISDGDALVEVTVPKTVPMKKVTLLAQRHGRHRVARRRRDGAHLPRRADRPGGRSQRVCRRLQRARQRPAVGQADDHQSPARRPGAAGCADRRRGSARRRCRWPSRATRRRSNASGLSTAALDAQCNIATEYKLFYRTTTAGCSTALPDPNPPAVPQPEQLLQALHAGHDAGRPGDHHHRPTA